MQPNARSLTVAVIAALTFLVGSTAHAAIVYEGFQYNGVGEELIGKPDVGDTDATGLAGSWVDSSATSGGQLQLRRPSDGR